MDANVALVRRLYEAFGAGDDDAARECFAGRQIAEGRGFQGDQYALDELWA
jgi:ketosteroid isomerase-like protein